jgi:hypothetical protein
MFFYIYGDYFELYETGKLQQTMPGRMPFGAISQGVLMGMAGVMLFPSLVPFLSLVVSVRLNRWLNTIRRGIQDGRVHEWLALLCHVRTNRNHIDATCRVLCVDLA